MVAEQPALSFAGLLRQLRAGAKLTQEELAAAAGVSARSVSNLERGVNRTAHKDTAVLLAGALGLTGPAAELFVAAARGNVPAGQVLAATKGAAPQPGAVTGSPYRGLAAFGEQDAAFFFGREAATGQVLDRMSRLLAGVGLLVVSGVSGAGKSSLLRAGVLPRIRADGLAAAPGAASWPCLVFTPTHAPLDELALRVAVLAGTDASAVRRGLDTSPEGFTLPARQAALARPPGPAGDGDGSAAEGGQPSPQRRLLLVVDQFEELFTQCADEGQRRAFITALRAAATARHGPDSTPAALVVLGVRADFEARCADYPQLADAVQDRYLVTAMTGRQLRMATTEPAKKAGSGVDDDLVETLLAEVRTGQPGTFGAGVLPLLSHALDQAWRSRTGETLTLADYERTGGIEGAVVGSAQHAYDRLTPTQQVAARQVFTRLTATSAEGVDSADRATKAELTEGKSPAEAQDVETVLEAFAAERLLTLAAGTVEISHEALLTAWPLLRDTWLADSHADRIARTRLHTTAAEWARHARDRSYLYSGSLLAAATGAATRIGADPGRHPSLSQTERDFLHASGQAHRRAVRRRQAVIAGLLALTLVAVTAAGIAVHNAATAARNAASARHQHAVALSRQLAAESLNIDSTNPVTARRLAVAAWAVFPTSQAASAITTLLAEQQQKGMLPADPYRVWAVTFSPSGKLLATADSDGTVRLWDPATGRAVGAPLHATARHGVYGVAFSPDGKLLASAGGDGTVRLWDPATARAVGKTLHASGRTTARYGVRAVAFSHNGKLLASAGADGTVRLWNPVTGRRVGTILHASARWGVFGVAFSPDGKLLASADGDGTVRLWDPATGRPAGAPIPSRIGPFGGHGAVAFSPNGKLLAISSGDGTVRLWDPATGRPAGPPHQTGAVYGVYGVAFSPDGKLLATADADGTVRLWNPATGQPAGPPIQAGNTFNSVYGVAFSPGGKLLASAGSGGTVRLWNPATGRPTHAPLHATSNQYGVNGVAFSPGGKLLASADGDGTVRLWNPATGRPTGAPLHATSNQYGALWVAFSPGGKLLASADNDGTVRLWNPATGRPTGAPLHATSNQYGVNGVAFSPGGKLLASADGDGTVRLWNPATGRPAGAPFHASAQNGGVHVVAFGLDGKLLAVGGGDGTVRLWNPATRRRVDVLQTGTGPNTGVWALAFSPNGKLLAAGCGDGTVRLWNPATGRTVATLHATTSSVYGVHALAFGPHGKLLATGEGDGTVRAWNPATGRPVGAPLQTGTGPADAVGALAFSPNGKLLAGSSGDGTVLLWQVSLFAHTYAQLCADAGPPTPQEWNHYTSGEPQPKVCR
ncbi:MAG TPA: helix-turn-helix domain-containing protein [Streptosporangiaceae bacterium]|nr:helix-turn-helix domain-containing protein [Streptosporangiaceae bacterium]